MRIFALVWNGRRSYRMTYATSNGDVVSAYLPRKLAQKMLRGLEGGK